MNFRQAAPVCGRAKVVGGVKAVVEKEPIDKRARDVPGMVENRTVIAMLMLNQVNGDNSPLPKYPGNAEISQSRPPIQKQQDADEYEEDGAFPLNAAVELRFLAFPARKV